MPQKEREGERGGERRREKKRELASVKVEDEKY
jgi:hypothetical protein